MRQQRAELDFTEDKEVAVMANEISGPHDEEDNDGDADDDFLMMEKALGSYRYDLQKCLAHKIRMAMMKTWTMMIFCMFFCECDTKIEIWVADKDDLDFSRG